MGRQVICQDTKIKTDSSILYKAEDNKYYSSEEIYKQIKLNNEYRSKAITELFNVLDYDTNIPPSSYLFREVKKYENDYELLYQTIESQKSTITYALSHKAFSSEINRVKYVMAIISNNIQEEARLRDKRNKKMSQMKQEEIENLDCVNTITKKKGTDVSRLLGEDDWI